MIYVLCPGNFKSGGPELLHQLVAEINSLKSHNAKIAYFDYKDKEKPYDNTLIKYINDDWVLEEEINDNSDNIIVIPEMNVEKINNYKHSKKYIWWMSVDNYKYTNRFRDMCEVGGLMHAINWTVKRKGYNKNGLVRKADLNLCQSYYAMNYLIHSMNISQEKIKYLSDYINTDYLLNSSKALTHSKKNIVLYNPKKGLPFTKKIMAEAQNITWVPLINMTNSEMRKMLESAKVYIDFGQHPGKDRLPREAAINGCCVITDKEGSAAFTGDVPINDEYKFDLRVEEIPNIIKKVNDCLNNYSDRINDFSKYRDFILNEKVLFSQNTKEIFD